MVAAGLVDPASWTVTGDEARTAYVSGQDCSYIFNGGGHNGRIQNDMNLVKKGYQEWMLPALLNPATGKRGYTSEEMFWGVATLGSLKNNNPVAAARVINYLISDEGNKLTAVGIQGRDYEEKDGQITFLPQRTKDGFPSELGDAGAHPLAFAVVSWQPMKWQNFTLLYGHDKAFADWYSQMWQNQIKFQIPTYGISVTSPKWNDFQATGEDLINRAFVAAVKAKSDDEVSKIFDQFVQDWLAAGGKDATAEMSAYMQTLYK
jgi:putative aldouronate transport system substrate-binding protein